MAKRELSVALLGATGAVGRAVLEALSDREVPLAFVRALDSGRQAGAEVELAGETLRVQAVKDEAFRGCDVAILAASSDGAQRWAPKARAEGCAVVDVSPAFRMDPEVPLVVPEVNGGALAGWRAKGIVASPGASAVALALALKPLAAVARISAVHAVTLESASGAGQLGLRQLETEAHSLMNAVEPEPVGAVPHRLAFNVVPQVGEPAGEGRTSAEVSTAAELRRLLDAPDLPVSITAVRVPVFYGHLAVVSVRTAAPLDVQAAREALRHAAGVKVLDATEESIYPMPSLSLNDDSVLAGRLRRDPAGEGLQLVLALDNLRKGAATNAVQIVEALRDAGL